ncbi:PadR family transcriptional regulator [Virgibacillus sp. 179-BFC.A HS]|uniref:PadR family transcriptional regulator n=1 Tax=Tigheibacillus jepli TaxID=3035914 RepID=A0ABU5CLA3_9BACI|nr:PadR family transcriptional regulator [Virgibacillus sp. 179-BFC.A HS]MDY0406617.1 PadR family transcriptional regulator [Virgibacillus sp. 179-BFC.A HS]
MKTETKFIVLGMLTIGCKTGYEIKKLIDTSFSYFWKMSYGQIYPALKKLVDESLAIVIQVDGDPLERKQYEITEKGRGKLLQWLEMPVLETGIQRNEFLVKLFFGRHLSLEKVLAHLDMQKELLKAKQVIFMEIEKSIFEQKESDDTPYWLYTLDYGKRMNETALAWCEDKKRAILERRNRVGSKKRTTINNEEC